MHKILSFCSVNCLSHAEEAETAKRMKKKGRGGPESRTRCICTRRCQCCWECLNCFWLTLWLVCSRKGNQTEIPSHPQKMTPVGFEPTPFRNGALSHRLRPLGQSVLAWQVGVAQSLYFCCFGLLRGISDLAQKVVRLRVGLFLATLYTRRMRFYTACKILGAL